MYNKYQISFYMEIRVNHQWEVTKKMLTIPKSTIFYMLIIIICNNLILSQLHMTQVLGEHHNRWSLHVFWLYNCDVPIRLVYLPIFLWLMLLLLTTDWEPQMTWSKSKRHALQLNTSHKSCKAQRLTNIHQVHKSLYMIQTCEFIIKIISP